MVAATTRCEAAALHLTVEFDRQPTRRLTPFMIAWSDEPAGFLPSAVRPAPDQAGCLRSTDRYNALSVKANKDGELMIRRVVKRWWRRAEAQFPERHIYIRSRGAVTGLVLTTEHQIAIVSGLALLTLWLALSTGTMLVGFVTVGSGAREAVQMQARYERLIAERDARLNRGGSSVEALVQSTERRHEALVMLFSQAHDDPKLAQAVTPATLASFAGRSPGDGVNAVRLDQDRLIAQAELYSKSRAARLRLAYRLAGLDPTAFDRSALLGRGGPLIEAKDPRALAAVLDVDEGFAQRIAHAATDLAETQALDSALHRLPLSAPTEGTTRASAFGVRIDPFNGQPAFHPGLDFAGPMLTPIHATGPGVVSFTGVRTGYGETIEIDHGHGLKTRYGHLAAISVRTGDQVTLGQRIGAMG